MFMWAFFGKQPVTDYINQTKSDFPVTELNSNIPSFLAQYAENQVTKQILPVWVKHAMRQKEGVMGAMSASGQPVVNGPKGAVMNARALWSFAFAYRQTRNPRLFLAAAHCYDGFIDQFEDREYGGMYWTVDSAGRPIDDSKALLAQTYALYAFAQYYAASGDSTALLRANRLAQLIETRYLRSDGTYASEFARDFSASTPEIENETDSCHQLHVLEALTQLYLVQPTDAIKQSLTHIIELFLVRIFPAEKHLPMLFDRQWQVLNPARSYGHNFEAPWLLSLACQAIQDKERGLCVDHEMKRLVDLTLEEGLHSEGGFLYGLDSAGQPTGTLTWWGQAEASNALQHVYRFTQDERYLNALAQLWQDIKAHWVDTENDEWFTDLDLHLRPTGNLNKADLWRCVYHSTRACFALSRGEDALLTPIKNNETDAFTAAVAPSLIGF